jgi:uncharacterized protein (TIGR03435 family)
LKPVAVLAAATGPRVRRLAGTSLTDAVQSMGLKPESRKAAVDQLIVDRIEKTPTEN